MEQFRLSNNHGSDEWGKMIYPYDLIKLLHDFIFTIKLWKKKKNKREWSLKWNSKSV